MPSLPSLSSATPATGPDAFRTATAPARHRREPSAVETPHAARGQPAYGLEEFADPASRPARPRAGRALRVGVLHARFDHRPETFATLARCARIDPDRIELHAIALDATGTPLEGRWREFCREFHVLPRGLAAQLHALVALGLDCLVFGDSLAAHSSPLSQLARRRVAPLQIGTDPVTTGIGAVDLLLSGELDLPARHLRAHTERLALLPGTALAWDCGPDQTAENTLRTRASLDIAEARTLLIGSLPEPLHPATLARWTALLDASPEATFLWVPAPGSADLDEARAALARAAHPRLILHEPAHLGYAGLASLFALADLALAPSGPAAALALEAGVPLLLGADHPESALLRSAGLDDLIAPDLDALFARAADAAAKPAERAKLREQVSSAMDRLPRFADPHALAADFTALLESGWDQLCALGLPAFRRRREPLRLAAPPQPTAERRRAEGLRLLEQGRHEPALPHLLSALRHTGGDATLWFDLARAYHGAGQEPAALEALEASLRLAADNAAAWRLLCELAVAVGDLDLSREALGLAAALEEEHPEPAAPRARVA